MKNQNTTIEHVWNEDAQSWELSHESRKFLIDWMGCMFLNDKVRKSYNMKQIVEGLFGYISGQEIEDIMKEAGVKGDRFEHNVSKESIEVMLLHYDWIYDFYIEQALNPFKYKQMKKIKEDDK
ncbi:hypothetical protein ABLO26_25615 [Neobacillus sp. 179-J 1A1 HS]|uniref:hypothetical protein n=1 Tax=Neobacillus driksii TaxID=3035913 RepID=UPI0035BC8F24